MKFIPGFEKNIVILFNETENANDIKRSEGLSAVNKARIQYETSPEDPAFKQEYMNALEKFIGDNKGQDNAPYENTLNDLKNKN